MATPRTTATPHPVVATTGQLVVVVDLTDTLSSGWRAGIQRVVVQLVDHLRHLDDRIELVPVVWSRALQGHRRLRPAELADLLGPGERRGAAQAVSRPATGFVARLREGARTGWVRTRREVGRALRFALRVGVLVLTVARVKDPVRDALRALSLRTVRRDHVELAVGPLPHGAVFFDIDTVWNQTSVDRDELYRNLDAAGVHVAVLVYDLLPLEHPEWFEQSLVEVFGTTLRAQASHADLVLAISRASARSFSTWATGQGLTPPAPVVVGLGADAVREPRRDTSSASLPAGVRGGEYVLVVGTVEPRKNHAVLLDAFERLAVHDPRAQLVVVGRAGWENDEVVRRLEHHPLAGTSLWWFRDADDELLGRLYDHARVVAVPSATEGFGLPVVEAFGHGVPVVASDGGALPEAGGDLAEYVGATDVEGWVAALGRHLHDDDHARARRDALAGYRAPSWNDTARQVAAALCDRFSPTDTA